MKDLSDVTFTIPVRYDSEDRMRNLDIVVSHILRNFDTTIFICESGPQQIIRKSKLDQWGSSVYYFYIHDSSDFFHKAKNLNLMAVKSTNPILVHHDADVLLYPKQYINAVNKIRAGYTMCYGYKERIVNIPSSYVSQWNEKERLSKITRKFKSKWLGLCGGAVFWDRRTFLEGGMANEIFRSWGNEDDEMRDRFLILGYRMTHVTGNIIHLNHSRGQNSTKLNPFYKTGVKEYYKILSMNRKELSTYMKTWPYLKNYSL
jgi:hypothetical protein